jgi:hypothetical protein
MSAEKFLGKPCKRNHLEGDTGKTLRFCSSGSCCKCSPIYDRAKRARRRAALELVRERVYSKGV